MAESIRIGVYICHCGINIAGVIDVKQVVDHAKTLPNVVVSKDLVFTCSSVGQNTIIEDIKNEGINRVVVAACSPRMHEGTFRNAVEKAGLNPYLFEMANIREHSSWVHPDDPEGATEKAKTLVRMAVAKARLLEPIEKSTAEVTKKVLVIGGGIAGLQASLDAAERGLSVTLVEKLPVLGGKAALIGDLVYSEKKGWQIAKELIEKVVTHENIRVLTRTTVQNVSGAFGDYRVSFVTEPRYIKETCMHPEKGEEVCPVEVPNEYDFGLTQRKAFFKPFEGAYPPTYVIDMSACTKCGLCLDSCGKETIDLDAKPLEFSEEFGTIIVAAGYKPYVPTTGEYGFGNDTRIITLSQLERIMSENGPSFEDIGLSNPLENIIFISCVGSMEESDNTDARTYCSRMCCSSSIKNMLKLRELFPSSNIYFLYRDIRTYARREEHLYEQASKSGIIFLKYEASNPPEVSINGKPSVKVLDTLVGKRIQILADLVVLANGMMPPSDILKLRSLLKFPCSPDGWVAEAHPKLRPVELPSPGVYIAGSIQAPKDIIESIISASAATAKAVVPIIHGRVELEPLVSYVNEDICGACGICVSTCPYDAVSRVVLQDGRRVARVNPRLCMGCGQCASACPSAAMQQKSFTDEQIHEMIEQLVV